MYSGINEAIQSIPRRANQRLGGAFANVPNEALLPTLRSLNSQIIVGRAGMGKTHLLLELERQLRDEGVACAFVDVEAVGTASDLYGNSPETWDHALRATRLAVDALESIHDAVRISILDDESMDSETAEWLQRLGSAITQVRVAGEEERSEKRESQNVRKKEGGLSVGLSPAGPTGSLRLSKGSSAEELSSTLVVQKGQADVWLHLNSVRRAFEGLGRHRNGLFVLFDSWDSLPPLLQPWLADLVQRLLWNTRDCVVKIAATEFPRFEKNLADGRLGLTTSSAATIDLDARIASPADVSQQTQLLSILHEHVKEVMSRVAVTEDLGDGLDAFVELAFADPAAATYLVTAAERNPRDALTIADRAAQMAGLAPIKTTDIASAASFLAVARRAPDLSIPAGLENWLADIVLGPGRSRSFYVPLRAGQIPPPLQEMYERRLLHADDRNQATSEQNPHEKFDRWHVDFGYALHLMRTGSDSQPVRVPPIVDPDDPAAIPVYSEKDLLRKPSPPARKVVPPSEIAGLPGPWVEVASEALPGRGDFLMFDQQGRFETVELVEVPIILGRSSSSTIRIQDPTVSSRHAELVQNATGGWRIRDCDSKNGTSVNGRRIDTADLKSHDTIGLGAAELLYLRRGGGDPQAGLQQDR